MTPGATRATVGTSHGVVRGAEAEDGVLAFLGVPYAAPPVGLLRFEPPQPPRPWSGVREATGYGPTAPQPAVDGPVARLLPHVSLPGDDYLNLNVWTADPSGSRPVMVFIHGGSFTGGSGAIPTYAGAGFARHGVVLVTINYRLGADGFLWFGDGVPNLGLLDQIAALTWVRDNIRSFGGDPDNVTVFGESAGAMSVCTLLAMPVAAGLFRRAIAQSGAARCVLSPETAGWVGRRLAELLGVAATRAAIGEVSTAQLMAAQATLALEVAGESPEWGDDLARNIMPFEPVIDGDLLPVAPEEAIRSGVGAEVDLLIGTNTDEGNLFFVPTGVVVGAGEEALTGFVRARRYRPDLVEALQAARPGSSPGQLVADAMTDRFYRVPALDLARAHPRAHVYEFGWGSPAFGGTLGACHALELPFVFDTLADPGYAALLGEAPPQELADSVHRAWIAFATTGDPGWSPYDELTHTAMRFDTTSVLLTGYRPELLPE